MDREGAVGIETAHLSLAGAVTFLASSLIRHLLQHDAVASYPRLRERSAEISYQTLASSSSRQFIVTAWHVKCPDARLWVEKADTRRLDERPTTSRANLSHMRTMFAAS